jgi:acetylornithine deacetylase/succinyl-diaminopimelate desuccinylase-like protein
MTDQDLDTEIARLAARDLPLARELLAEAIRLPADHVGTDDPSSGLSNHEGPRLQYLKRRIVEIGAVAAPDDVSIDGFGNLTWQVHDPGDGVAPADRKVIYFDGHSDTVRALREQWTERLGAGVDAYNGLIDPDAVDEAALRGELGWLPPRDEWEHLLFGRGSADQLGGVIAQIIATRLLLELRPLGSLRGATVRAFATVAEEDNDGGGPMFVADHVWPQGPPHALPDVVVLTEGTGDADKGGLGIYRGQRGRMQIEVEVTGRSCHGSMPAQGLNPLEYGAAMLVEAAEAHARGEGMAEHPFLGKGTRTASWAALDTPSDCAVPQRFTFRFDRRLTVGESPEQARADIEAMASVARARDAGLVVDVRVPTYQTATWREHTPGNPAIYPGWETPEVHPAVAAAAEAYRRVVTPHVAPGGTGGQLRQEPRVDRWIFSTDGVGYVRDKAHAPTVVPANKAWIDTGDTVHPPTIGVGPGVEQNTHKLGECVDMRELQHAVAVLTRFVSVFAGGAQPSAG